MKVSRDVGFALAVDKEDGRRKRGTGVNARVCEG